MHLRPLHDLRFQSQNTTEKMHFMQHQLMKSLSHHEVTVSLSLKFLKQECSQVQCTSHRTNNIRIILKMHRLAKYNEQMVKPSQILFNIPVQGHGLKPLGT